MNRMLSIIAVLALCVTPERQAVAIASADAAQLSPIDRPAMRYVWVDSEPSKWQGQALSYALNTAVSHAAPIYLPTPVAGGRMYRLDLRRLAPQEKDLDRLLKTWESMASADPYFHAVRPLLVVKVKPYKASDGRIYDFVRKDVTAFALHAGGDEQTALSLELQTAVPIVRCDWFVAMMLRTTRGGLYYNFTGIKGLNQAQFLATLGASESQVASLRSDERSALLRSKVTNKPRRIDAFTGVGTRPSVGTGLVTVTHDVADEDVKAGQHPIRNLVAFEDKAREIIGQRRNGMLAFALFNAQGQLQDTVPDNIARDGTIPFPNTARLEPGISCIRCHGPHDGYQPFGNDVQALTLARPGQPRLNIFGDLSQSGSYDDLLDRLAGLYSGDLSEPVRLARNAHAKAVFQATRQNPSDAAANVSAVFGSYVYDEITPARAVRELGGFVDDEDTPAAAVKAFNELVPMLPGNPAPEDPVIAALRSGLSIVRADWEHVYADAALRVETSQKGKP